MASQKNPSSIHVEIFKQYFEDKAYVNIRNAYTSLIYNMFPLPTIGTYLSSSCISETRYHFRVKIFGFYMTFLT
jgi:hypothetical protein